MAVGSYIYQARLDPKSGKVINLKNFPEEQLLGLGEGWRYTSPEWADLEGHMWLLGCR